MKLLKESKLKSLLVNSSENTGIEREPQQPVEKKSYQPSSKCDHDGQKEQGPSKNTSQETKKMRSICKTHAVVIAHPGRLDSRLNQNNNQQHLQPIQAAVSTLNNLKYRAQFLAKYFLDSYFNNLNEEFENQTLPDAEMVKQMYQGETKGNGARLFWRSLLQFVNGVNGNACKIPLVQVIKNMKQSRTFQ